MKVFKLPAIIESRGGHEYCLGTEALKTHAVYLVYGKMRPGEAERKISPGKGHEEILFVVKGGLNARKGKMGFTLTEGEAFHLKEEEVFLLDNPTDREAVYVIAGGHTGAGVHACPEPSEQEPIIQTEDKED